MGSKAFKRATGAAMVRLTAAESALARVVTLGERKDCESWCSCREADGEAYRAHALTRLAGYVMSGAYYNAFDDTSDAMMGVYRALAAFDRLAAERNEHIAEAEAETRAAYLDVALGATPDERTGSDIRARARDARRGAAVGMLVSRAYALSPDPVARFESLDAYQEAM